MPTFTDMDYVIPVFLVLAGWGEKCMAQPLIVSRLYSDHSNIVTKPGIIIDYGSSWMHPKAEQWKFLLYTGINLAWSSPSWAIIHKCMNVVWLLYIIILTSLAWCTMITVLSSPAMDHLQSTIISGIKQWTLYIFPRYIIPKHACTLYTVTSTGAWLAFTIGGRPTQCICSCHSNTFCNMWSATRHYIAPLLICVIFSDFSYSLH